MAVTLGRHEEKGSPIKVDLYEGGSEITTVGAGISVWARTWAVMRQLGIYDQLAGEAVRQEPSGAEGQLADDTELSKHVLTVMRGTVTLTTPQNLRSSCASRIGSARVTNSEL